MENIFMYLFMWAWEKKGNEMNKASPFLLPSFLFSLLSQDCNWERGKEGGGETSAINSLGTQSSKPNQNQHLKLKGDPPTFTSFLWEKDVAK